MGLLKKIFGSTTKSKTQKILPWISLRDEQQIPDLLERSKSKPQVIFKYSTRCGINKMAMNDFVDHYELSEAQADLYYLDILNYRNVSSAVAQYFNVPHESPQVMVIKNAAVVAHKSHGAIAGLVLRTLV